MEISDLAVLWGMRSGVCYDILKKYYKKIDPFIDLT